jgi:hypothetical protein
VAKLSGVAARKSLAVLMSPSRPRRPRPDIVHTSVYLHEAAYETLRRIAFDDRRKIHDLIMEGVGLVFRKRGYAPLDELKAKWQGKAR